MQLLNSGKSAYFFTILAVQETSHTPSHFTLVALGSQQLVYSITELLGALELMFELQNPIIEISLII